MPAITVTMPWIANLSVNHAYLQAASGRKYMRPEVRQWQAALCCAIRAQLPRVRPTADDRITVTVSQHTARKTDGDNMFKIPVDAVKMALGVDDREFHTVSGDWVRTPEQEASIVVTVTWEEKE
jgi:Holliday junction resolvase RusA-like endonuclease